MDLKCCAKEKQTMLNLILCAHVNSTKVTKCPQTFVESNGISLSFCFASTQAKFRMSKNSHRQNKHFVGNRREDRQNGTDGRMDRWDVSKLGFGWFGLKLLKQTFNLSKCCFLFSDHNTLSIVAIHSQNQTNVDCVYFYKDSYSSSQLRLFLHKWNFVWTKRSFVWTQQNFVWPNQNFVLMMQIIFVPPLWNSNAKFRQS